MNVWMTCTRGLMVMTAVLVGPQLAAAQSPSVTRLQLQDGDQVLNESDLERYFNQASCTCDPRLTVAVSFSGISSADGTFELVHGRNCVDSAGDLSDECTSIVTRRASALSSTFETSVRVSALADGCGSKQQTRLLYAVFDEEGGSGWETLETLEYTVDTEPPPPPVTDRVLAGEELAEVVFSAPDEDEDVDKYQVLCRTSTTGEPGRTDIEAAFDSATTLCGIDDGAPPTDEACADAVSGPDSVTVLGLENGIRYEFFVVSIDAARNASEPVSVGTAVPAPEEDLWERYKRQGGDAEGGEYCFIATAAFGDYDHPQVRLLRRFRDEILRPTATGRLVIGLYYTHSPAWAATVRRSWVRQRVAQIVLFPVTSLARAALDPTAGAGMLGALFGALAVVRTSRRRAAKR